MRLFTGHVLALVLFVGGLCLPRPCDAQDKPFTFTKVDLKLLEETDLVDAKFEKDGLVYSDSGLTQYLTTIGLAVVGDQPVPEHVTWRFRALRDPLPNAFALPNGSIYVDSGLLALLENEDQLASVLAHEASHVVGRHPYLSYRSYRKKAAAGNIIGATAGGAIGGIAQVILASKLAGYSRELEADADQQGLQNMRAAGFDAAEMAAAFRLLQSSSDLELESEPTFYNDHPTLQARIEYAMKLAADGPVARPDADAAAEKHRRYISAVQHPTRDTVQQAIDARRYRSAVACARRLVEANPDSTEMRYLLGEAYRALGPRTPRPSEKERGESGRKQAQSNQFKLTVAEEEKRLLSLPEGQAAWSDNQGDSEEQYRKALALDETNFKAWRGLGLLFERAGRNQDAVAAYQKYLELALDPPDRARIHRHIDSIEKPTTNPG